MEKKQYLVPPNSKNLNLIFNLDGDIFTFHSVVACPCEYLIIEYPLYENNDRIYEQLDENRVKGEIYQVRRCHRTNRNIFLLFGNDEGISYLEMDYTFKNPNNELELNIPVIWGHGNINEKGEGIEFTKYQVDYIHYPIGFEPSEKFEAPKLEEYPQYSPVNLHLLTLSP